MIDPKNNYKNLKLHFTTKNRVKDSKINIHSNNMNK